MKHNAEPKKRSAGRILLRAAAALLALILLFALALWIIPLTETIPEEDRTAPSSVDWMSKLPDSVPLNRVVLPGTHDSATRFVQLAFFSKCQGLSVLEQLKAGYRYLDVRLGMEGDRLKLMHGFTTCRTGAAPWSDTLYFDDVLAECYAFLAAHPTETIVLAVKQEHGGETAEEFAACVERYVAQRPERWLVTDSFPSMKNARGKLVLMRRYEVGASPEGERISGIPMLWANQNGHEDVSLHTEQVDNGSYTLWVQDRFEYGSEDKWTAFTAGLAAAGTGSEDLAVHFLSTKGPMAYGHPFCRAKTLNARLMELPSAELSGWIIVDFGSAPLAGHIWQANELLPEE